VTLIQILILAIVRGLTEFLPVSSSGHLVVTSRVLDWPDQGLVIDIAVRAGTLLAVAIYFWRDMVRIIGGMMRLLAFRGGPDARLAAMLVVATLPVAGIGFAGSDALAPLSGNVEVIAWATIGFAILLWVADRIGMTVLRVEHISYFAAIVIGIAQILALIPGTSRPGITMTAGRFLGLERAEAARFSLLLSIPTIAGAGILAGRTLWRSGTVEIGYDAALAVALAFFAGISSIAVMMRWLEHSGYTPFVIYRLALGGALLYWVYI